MIREALWILNLHGDVATRSAVDASTDWEPVWSADGKRSAFASRRDRGTDQIYWKDLSGAGNEEGVWNSGTTPGGLVVRWKISVVHGSER
jgi:Tol biopolymer transport system component